MDDGKNPLKRFLKFLSTIGSIIGLSSLTEHWFENILQWRGFINEVVDNYRAIVYPIFDFVFAWMWPMAPRSFYDYVAVGCIVTAAFVRATPIPLSPTKIDLHPWDIMVQSKTGKVLFGAYGMIVVVLIQVALWPLTIVSASMSFFSTDKEDRRFVLQFWSWLATVVVGLALLLAINARLKT